MWPFRKKARIENCVLEYEDGVLRIYPCPGCDDEMGIVNVQTRIGSLALAIGPYAFVMDCPNKETDD